MSPRNQERKQGKRQGPSLLDEILERRVLLYMVAAGATLASASAAQAKVVFTPSHAVVGPGATLHIDLNHDGTTDFKLHVDSSSGYGIIWMAPTIGSNHILQSKSTFFSASFPAALKAGALIGGAFLNSRVAMAECIYTGIVPLYEGNFLNVTNCYLGVRFLINGTTHYGWIGFRSVRSCSKATLGGWAYETAPDKPIVAGAMGEQDAESNSAALRSAEPTSLELLAAGDVAVADWRRRLTEDLPASTPLLN